MQSICDYRTNVAIIMDGNGRWATRRGLPRNSGHYAGVMALRTTVATAAEQQIASLTVYAFSSDNWRRPKAEVSGLMNLIRGFLKRELAELYRNNVRVTFIGRRDRLDDDVVGHIKHAEAVTKSCTGLHVRIALDYSAQDAILRVADTYARAGSSRCAFGRALADDGGPYAIDLLIRTGGEQRLSDFLLWEAAYAELIFTDTLWPDFSGDDLIAALNELQRRERRYGALPGGEQAVLPAAAVQ